MGDSENLGRDLRWYHQRRCGDEIGSHTTNSYQLRCSALHPPVTLGVISRRTIVGPRVGLGLSLLGDQANRTIDVLQFHRPNFGLSNTSFFKILYYTMPARV